MKKRKIGREVRFEARSKKQKVPDKVKVDDNDPICLICLKAFDERSRDENWGAQWVGSTGNAETYIKQETYCGDHEATEKNSLGNVTDTIISPPEPAASVSEEVGGGWRRSSVFMAFLRIVERYLGVRTDRFQPSAEGTGRFSPLCNDCFLSVRKLCEVYGEWENVGMKLGWRLAQISKTIENSKLRVPGSKALRLSTRLEGFSPKSVGLFRNQVALRCSEKANSMRVLPDVLIDRNSCLNAMKHKLKVPVREMEQYLKTLILIFALARKKEEDSVETRLQSMEHIDNVAEAKAEVDCNECEVAERPTVDVDKAFEMTVESPDPASPCGEWEDSEMTNNVFDSNPGVHKADGQHTKSGPKSRRRTLRKNTKKLNDKAVNQDEETDSFKTDPVLVRPKFPCNHCSRSFIVEHGLRMHLSRGPCSLLSGFLYKCKECQQQFKRKKELNAHTAKFHGRDNTFRGNPKPTQCNVCQEMLPSRKELIVHFQDVHGMTKDGKFTCEICGVVVKRGSSYGSHMKRHARLKCTLCSVQFKTIAGLRGHEHREHGRENTIKCTFEGCNRTFYDASVLNHHLIYHREKRLKCPLCPRTFYTINNFKRHQLVHKQEKNHVCQFCGRMFVSPCGLKIHLDIHLGIKNFKCSYCQKAFCRKFALECHERTHTKEKPFMCKFCGKGFSTATSVKMHEKIHDKLKSSVILRRPFRKTVAVDGPLSANTEEPNCDQMNKEEMNQQEETRSRDAFSKNTSEDLSAVSNNDAQAGASLSSSHFPVFLNVES